MNSLDRLRWSDHICHFYDSADDLGELLVPYFKAGLENNEAGLWVTSRPYGSDRAIGEMQAAMPDFDRRMRSGQIQIVAYDEWYTRQGMLSAADTIRNWMVHADQARDSGYSGLRITGNTSFLDKSTWDEFLHYERSLDAALSGQPILTLCSYCRATSSTAEVLDVACAHGLSLSKRQGQWHLIDFNPPPPVSRQQIGGPKIPRLPLDAIFQCQLASLMENDRRRITLDGPRVQLSRRQATTFAMLLQELVLNATRHGALSTPEGTIAAEWRLAINGSRRLFVKWDEFSPLALNPPESVGSGTRLMGQLAENCVRVYETGHMTCTFELDLRES